jgi:ubiquinone/menaquinone biosynthesis C-methylase UbiE
MGNAWHALLRLFFRLLYHELAWSYDLVAWLVSLGQWQAWGRTTLPHLQGERVLELGHGPGHLLAALAQRGFAPVGVDPSPTMARQAKHRLHKSDLAVPLARARAQALPFRSDGFDSVVATFPTNFIVHPQTLNEVKRVLTPHGRFVVALATRFEGERLLSRFLTWLYHVTGQSQPSPHSYVPGLEEAGLSSRIVWEEVDQTAVMLIVAEKD